MPPSPSTMNHCVRRKKPAPKEYRPQSAWSRPSHHLRSPSPVQFRAGNALTCHFLPSPSLRYSGGRRTFALPRSPTAICPSRLAPGFGYHHGGSWLPQWQVFGGLHHHAQTVANLGFPAWMGYVSALLNSLAVCWFLSALYPRSRICDRHRPAGRNLEGSLEQWPDWIPRSPRD